MRFSILVMFHSILGLAIFGSYVLSLVKEGRANLLTIGLAWVQVLYGVVLLFAMATGRVEDHERSLLWIAMKMALGAVMVLAFHISRGTHSKTALNVGAALTALTWGLATLTV